MPVMKVVGGARFTLNADHRNGICELCLVRMEVKDVILGNGKVIRLPVCPKCGDGQGQLISRPFTIEPPEPPQCLSLKCLFKFIVESLYVAFLSSYHRRRVAYAEANRPEKRKILDRYRTGEPSPKNLWQAIHANLKLTCPVCRKYNVDPLSFGGKDNGTNTDLDK